MKRVYIELLKYLETSYIGGILFIGIGIAIIRFKSNYKIGGIAVIIFGMLIIILKIMGKI